LSHLWHHRLPCLGWAIGWATRAPAAEPPGPASAPNATGRTARARLRARRCRRGASDRHPHRPALAARAVKAMRRKRAGPPRARSVPNVSPPCRVRRRRSSLPAGHWIPRHYRRSERTRRRQPGPGARDHEPV
jgi:hypothetical protein